MFLPDIEKLQRLHESMEPQLHEYITELDRIAEQLPQLRIAAVEMLQRIRNGNSQVNGNHHATRLVKPPTPAEIPFEPDEVAGHLPKTRVIAAAIDTIPLNGSFRGPDVLAVLRKTHSQEQISDKDVRRVLSRVANMPHPRLQTLRRGIGVTPSLYKRVGNISELFAPRVRDDSGQFARSNDAAG